MNRLLARAKNYSREKKKKKKQTTQQEKQNEFVTGLSRSIYQVQNNKKKWANGTLLERPQLLE